MKTAIFPGSFDPITAGHLDIIERAAVIFDEVIVCVMVNGEKRPFLTMEERIKIVRASIAHIGNARAAVCSGLLADFAGEQNAQTLVKGVRGSVDFDWEYQMAQINRGLRQELDTVFFPAKPENLHISSTMAREMIRYGQDLSGVIPAGGLKTLDSILAGRAGRKER